MPVACLKTLSGLHIPTDDLRNCRSCGVLLSPLTDSVPRGSVDTSQHAFDSNRFRTPQQREVYELIDARAESGATMDEIASGLGWDTNTASPRVNELYRSGLIARSGRKRITRNGRAAHVWVTATYAPEPVRQ